MDKLLGFIGLAMKAGKLVSGEFLTEKLIKTGKAKLVMIAEDASNNTKKLFVDKCSYYKVPIYIAYDKATLGYALGKSERASLGISDRGFSTAIEKILKEKRRCNN